MELLAIGPVTGQEIIDALEQAYATEDLSGLGYKLIDRTDCTEYRVTSDEVRRIAKLDQTLAMRNPDVYMLFISTTPLQYGMTRVWQAYTDQTGLPREIFDDRAAADAWLAERFPADDA